MTPENSGKKQKDTRFQPGRSGNPAGKPKGARHKASLLAEQLLDGQAEALVQKAIELALTGDTVALRLCLERLLPPRRDRAISLTLTAIQKPEDVSKVSAEILEAITEGRLTPEEGSTIAGVLDHCRKAIELTKIEKRLAALEEQLLKKG